MSAALVMPVAPAAGPVLLPELEYLAMVENLARATATMAEILPHPKLRDDDDLQAMLGAVRTVIDMVRAVEAEKPRLFLGTDRLVEAVALVQVLSVDELDGEAHRDLVAAARACADVVAAELVVAREDATRAAAALAATVPLPDSKQMQLLARYRRDLERRLESELKVLSLVRERKVQVAGSSGLVGQPIPIRLVG